MANEDYELMPLDAVRRELGRRLEAYRISRQLRQEDLAAQAGVSVPTLSRLENGTGGTIDTLLHVLRALGLTGRIVDLFPDASRSPHYYRGGQERQRVRVKPEAGAQEAAPWRWAEDAVDDGDGDGA